MGKPLYIIGTVLLIAWYVGVVSFAAGGLFHTILIPGLLSFFIAKLIDSIPINYL